jgi:Tripartite tricarboxylate transporter family receptor
MEVSRRKLLKLAAGSAALPTASVGALAQHYPTRPVHVLVGFAAGGPTDITARLMNSWLSQRLGQQFVIENRPGAGTNLATAAVTRAPADGYTLLLVTVANVVNASLYDNLDFNFINDVAPVAGIMRAPSVMVINPSVPAKTVPEFIAYAKENPGKINMATAGNGSGPHIYGELFKMMAGVDLVTIAYRGGAPALIDLLAGQTQVMFEGIVSSNRLYQGEQTARAGGHDGHAVSGAARRSDHRRIRARLRGERIFRCRCAKKYARRSCRQARPRNQCRPRRSFDQGADHGPGRHPDADDVRRVRQAHCRIDRQVGKGDPHARHQGRIVQANGADWTASEWRS